MSAHAIYIELYTFVVDSKLIISRFMMLGGASSRKADTEELAQALIKLIERQVAA